jgi:hypothetical protein
VGFAALAPAGMAVMLVRFVDHHEIGRLQALLEPLFDQIRQSHLVQPFLNGPAAKSVPLLPVVADHS